MAAAYPTNEQYDRWKEHASEYDMTVSGFIASMVEAGLKKFDGEVEPDATNQELREQRDDLKTELDHARDRITELEDRLYYSDSMAIQSYVEENPGADFEDITDHLRATVPERANAHLEVMEGDDLEVFDQMYYPREDDEETREAVQRRG